MLRNVQQRELRLSPFEQHGVPFPLVVAESDILTVNVPVPRFQFPYQLAFRVSLTAQQLRRTHIESQRAKQNRIGTELAEHGIELPQVLVQQSVRLPFRYGVCRVSLTFL